MQCVVITSARDLPRADWVAPQSPYFEARVAHAGTDWDDAEPLDNGVSPVLAHAGPNPAWWHPVRLGTTCRDCVLAAKARSEDPLGLLYKMVVAGGVATSGVLIGGAVANVAIPGAIAVGTGVVAGLAMGVAQCGGRGESKGSEDDDGDCTASLFIRVYDRDVFTSDDVLGEARVPLAALEPQVGRVQSFPLFRGDEVVATISVGIPGSVEELVEWTAASTARGEEGHDMSAADFVSSGIRAVLRGADDDLVYSANMAEFLLSGFRSETSMRDYFMAKVHAEGTGRYLEWDGPEDAGQSVTVNAHADVVARMAAFDHNVRTGRWERVHHLGFQKLDRALWRHLPGDAQRIGIGQSERYHAPTARLLEARLGALGSRALRIRCDRFWDAWLVGNGGMFSTGSDIRGAVCALLHSVLVDIDLTPEEANEFMETQKRILVVGALQGAPLALAGAALGLSKLVEFRKRWEARYLARLLELFPADSTVGGDLRDEELGPVMAAGVLDALLYAGGQSVPTVVSYCLALLFGEWLYAQLPGFVLSNVTLHAFVFEVIRFFPPVAGVVYRDLTASPPKKVYLNMFMAQCDPRAWGPTAASFRLRPLEVHAANQVGWARGGRTCPGKDLSVAITCSFLESFARHGSFLAGRGDPDDARFVLNPLHFVPSCRPGEIDINNYAATEFTLRPRRVRDVVPSEIVADTGFRGIDAFTTAYLQIAARKVDPFAPPEAPDHEFAFDAPRRREVFMNPAFCPAVRILADDEDAPRSDVESLVSSLLTGASASLPLYDPEVFFASPEQGVATMRDVVGHLLPPQHRAWGDMSSDAALVNLCFSGIGQLMLRRAAATDELVVDLTHLGAFDVREGFARYGARTRFSATREPIGIFVCDLDREVLRGDPEWEHAKFMFRVSLFADVTLRHHLAYTHLVVSNTAVVTALESLGGHPLRRMLRPHTYRTVEINRAAATVLLPVDQLAFRTWGFTAASWGALLEASCAMWGSEDAFFWPAFEAARAAEGLFGVDLPFHEDAGDAWNTIRAYVEAMLDRMAAEGFLGDGDAQAVLFVETLRESPLYADKLPFGEGRVAVLTEYLTHVIWTVSGMHEFVGSVAEYLVHPRGCMPKARPGAVEGDIQSFALVLALMALTGVRQPPFLSQAWHNVFPDGSHFRTIQASFFSALSRLSDRIAARNRDREVPCFSWDPLRWESSVSV